MESNITEFNRNFTCAVGCNVYHKNICYTFRMLKYDENDYICLSKLHQHALQRS